MFEFTEKGHSQKLLNQVGSSCCRNPLRLAQAFMNHMLARAVLLVRRAAIFVSAPIMCPSVCMSAAAALCTPRPCARQHVDQQVCVTTVHAPAFALLQMLVDVRSLDVIYRGDATPDLYTREEASVGRHSALHACLHVAAPWFVGH
jgi:hypothetical protein